MARTIGDELDELAVRTPIALRLKRIEGVADSMHDLERRALAVAADVVRLAGKTARCDKGEGLAVIADEEPVADVAPVAVDRKRLALECVERHERDELLRELVGAIVVRAVRREDGKPVRMKVGPNEVIGRGLRRRVRRVRRVARLFGEQARRPERSEYLVGRDVHEAEGLLVGPFERPVKVPRGIEHFEGARHVGANELARPVDRAVDVRLGSEVEHRRWAKARKERANEVAIADVAVNELVSRRTRDGREIVEISRVRQSVENDDRSVAVLPTEVMDEVGANEAGASSDEKSSRHGGIRRSRC